MRTRRLAGLALSLLTIVCGSTAAAQEVAAVDVRGQPVFTVAGVNDTSAVLRSRVIETRIEERLATDAPIAPLTVSGSDTTALVLIAGDTLLQVTRRDAEVFLSRAIPPGGADRATREVAAAWAAALRPVFLRLAGEEQERVVLDGIPLFAVSGTPELRAARRAAAIGLRVSEFAAAPGEPPPLRVVERGEGAAVMAGSELLVQVSAADAVASGEPAGEVAAEWAAEIERAAGVVRGQRDWPYLLRVLGLAGAAALVASAIHLLLNRAVRRLDVPRRPDEGLGGSIASVAGRWGVRLLQLALWIGLATLVLYLLPRTRPFVYATVDRGVGMLTGALDWFLGAGLVVVLIVVTTVVAARFVGAVVRHIVLSFGLRRGGRVELRAGTLAGTVAAGAQLLVLFVGVLTVLAQLEMDPLPLLASAGVAGIALGFGVQTLIRDFFTGFFILLEDQYGVGDVIRVAGTSGTVERLTLRITQIRGIDGSLTSIPNGEITTVTNLSKDYAQVVIDAPIALNEDVDRATEVIERTARELASEWADRMRGEPEVLGVETVDAAARAITIRVILKTAPLERFRVSRELRRRIVDAFAEAEIEGPPRSALTLPDSARTP